MKPFIFLKWILVMLFVSPFCQARDLSIYSKALPAPGTIDLDKKDFFQMYVPMLDCKEGQFQVEFTRFGENESEIAFPSCPEISIQMNDLFLKLMPNGDETISLAQWKWISYQFDMQQDEEGNLIIHLPDRDPDTAKDYEPGMDLRNLANFTDGAILDRKGIMTIKQRWYSDDKYNPKDRVYLLEPNTQVIIHTLKPYKTKTLVFLNKNPVTIKTSPQSFNLLGVYIPLGNPEALKIFFKYNFLSNSQKITYSAP